jgi:hypothetical protein
MTAGCAALAIASCTPAPPPPPTNPQAPFEAGSPVEDATPVGRDAAIDALVDAWVAPAASARSGGSSATEVRADAGTRAQVVVAKTADAGSPQSGPAREGEVCATYSYQPMPMSGPPLHRPCAPGLVCCVPPHGARMMVETAYCRVPCKPTPPSAQPQMAGCSGDGCPWAAVP